MNSISSREDRRRHALRRLPGVQRRQARGRRRASGRPCERARVTRPGPRPERRAARSRGTDEAAADARRRSHAGDERLQALRRRVRDRHEHLVGLELARAGAPRSSRPPSTLTPWIRRRRTRGLSSRKPTTRSVGRLAQLAREAPAGAAGADDQHRARCAPRRRVPQRPAACAAPRREPATSGAHSSASTTKISSGKSSSGRVARDDRDRDRHRERDRGRDREAGRARDANRQTRR